MGNVTCEIRGCLHFRRRMLLSGKRVAAPALKTCLFNPSRSDKDDQITLYHFFAVFGEVCTDILDPKLSSGSKNCYNTLLSDTQCAAIRFLIGQNIYVLYNNLVLYTPTVLYVL